MEVYIVLLPNAVSLPCFQSLCDVTLICRPKDSPSSGDSAASSPSPNERRFTAHKAILGARSPVFLAMFRHADLKVGLGRKFRISHHRFGISKCIITMTKNSQQMNYSDGQKR